MSSVILPEPVVIKIEVNPDLSYMIQRIVFAHRGSWTATGDRHIKYLEKPFLYIGRLLDLRYSSEDLKHYPLVSTQEFLARVFEDSKRFPLK